MIDPKKFLKTVPSQPGVYQMLNVDQQVLYVGKAKNLRKRLASYFRKDQDIKTSAFMRQVVKIEIIITENENAALLLENNLIKTLHPHYNILFKDDKSFPYLLLTDHEFPRLTIHRGPKKNRGHYFGPFPNSQAVHQVLNLLQRVFRLRKCGDNFFRNRSRPCIQYQIKRCTAPCVRYISKIKYGDNVQFVEQFLSGKSDVIIQKITQMMEDAAAKLEYENASFYRDQIASLRDIQRQQIIVKDRGDIDAIGIASVQNQVGINILLIRKGLVIGNHSFFTEVKGEVNYSEIIETFILQHYLGHAAPEMIPRKIMVQIHLPNRSWIERALSERLQQKMVLQDQVKGDSRKLLAMAAANIDYAMKNRFQQLITFSQQLASFTEFFSLTSLPRCIDCFDVSHTMGESTVASCVVFDQQGACKKNYRRFNIQTAGASDDYAALREVLIRRYQNADDLPDVIIIDGGKGQLNTAVNVLQKFPIEKVLLMAIAKGPSRKPGLEEIHLLGRQSPISFDPASPVLHLLQQIRDEAHRFAISGHRQKLVKNRKQSILENVPGVGAKRRAEILKHFGGLQAVKQASIEELAAVKGVQKSLAKLIYEYLHQ